MTIEKGAVWGGPGPLPTDGVTARTDAEIRRIAEAADRTGTPMPTIGLLGGDLCRTVGGRGIEARLHGDDAMTLPMDLGLVTIDGTTHRFCAHVVARRGWWRGPLVAVMNAQWIGTWDVAPKSHPNDGLLDVFDATAMSADDRLKARRRLLTGTHVPHHDIAQRRTSAIELDFDRPTRVWVDGEPVGRARHLSIRLEPDAWHAVV